MFLEPEFSIVVPVYNEGENIGRLLRGLVSKVQGNYEIVIVYDFDGDNTLPAVRALDPPVANLRLVRNDLGRGVVCALRAGFEASRGWLGVVVTMADLSDPPEVVMDLVAKLREGYDVVAGSRYMPGGKQIGGPKLKGFLSWLAGAIAYRASGVGIHDVTTNFRAYSKRLIATTPIESRGGFEFGLELTTKCHLRGWRVGEVPSTWHDRTAGASRFKLFAWLPGYLRWYLKLLSGDFLGLSKRIRRLRENGPTPTAYGGLTGFGVYESPRTGGETGRLAWEVRRWFPARVVIASTAEDRLLLQKNADETWSLPTYGALSRESVVEQLSDEIGKMDRLAGGIVCVGWSSREPVQKWIWNAAGDLGFLGVAGLRIRGCEPSADTGSSGRNQALDRAEVARLIQENRIRDGYSLAGIACWLAESFTNPNAPTPLAAEETPAE